MLKNYSKNNYFTFREMEMIRTILILICCYTLCASPITVLFLMAHTHLFEKTIDSTTETPYYILSFIPYVLQFALNFVVYALSNEQYMEAYKSYIKYLGGKFRHGKVNTEQRRECFEINLHRRFSDSCIVNGVKKCDQLNQGRRTINHEAPESLCCDSRKCRAGSRQHNVRVNLENQERYNAGMRHTSGFSDSCMVNGERKWDQFNQESRTINHEAPDSSCCGSSYCSVNVENRERSNLGMRHTSGNEVIVENWYQNIPLHKMEPREINSL